MNTLNLSKPAISSDAKRRKVNYQRVLYFLFTVELLVQLTWTSLALAFFSDLGTAILGHWELALISGVLIIFILIICFCFKALQRSPINLIVYLIFTIVSAYFISWIVLADRTLLVYYALWLLTGVSVAYTVYSWASPACISTLVSFIVTLIPTMLVFLIFLIFSEIVFVGLLAVLLAVIYYGFYLNLDTRRAVSGSSGNEGREDAWVGAVTIWIDALMASVRIVELIVNGFFR